MTANPGASGKVFCPGFDDLALLIVLRLCQLLDDEQFKRMERLYRLATKAKKSSGMDLRTALMQECGLEEHVFSAIREAYCSVIIDFQIHLEGRLRHHGTLQSPDDYKVYKEDLAACIEQHPFMLEVYSEMLKKRELNPIREFSKILSDLKVHHLAKRNIVAAEKQLPLLKRLGRKIQNLFHS